MSYKYKTVSLCFIFVFTKFCGEMICKAQNGSLYSELTAEELTKMLMAAEQKNDVLEKENIRLQGKVRELYMKF